MRLQEVRATNFGIFGQKRFEFGDDGLVVVHGPNEAGKTTLLQLLRELLFGFPHVSAYALEGAGPMSAAAEAVLEDGRRLYFTRRKKMSGSVEGQLEPGGAPIDDAKLSQLLGNASSPFYQNVFAFSLTELADGASSFDTAGLTLTEALFGSGSSGLSHLPRVKRQLREEREGLFKPQARKPPINDLARLVKEDRRKLKDATIKPTRYTELQDTLARLQGDIAAAQERERMLLGDGAHLDRLQHAWKHWREREDLEQSLAELSVPESVRAGDAERYDQFANTVADLQTQITAQAAELDANVREQAELVIDPALVAAMPKIKVLEQDLGKIGGFLRDLPERAKDLAGIEAKLADDLKALHPDWQVSHLPALRPSLDQRVRIDALAAQFQSLTTDRMAATIESDRLTAQIVRQQQRLSEQTEDADHEALSAVLAQQPEYAAAKGTLRQHEKLEQALAAEIGRLAAKLSAVVADVSLHLNAITPPLAAAVADFRDRLQRDETELATARDRARQAEEQARTIADQLAHLEAGGAIPDQRVLAEARRRRDEGWKLIRRHYIENQAIDARINAWLRDPLGSLPEEFLKSQHEADALADERQRLSEQVARKEQLLQQQQALGERGAKLTAEVAAAVEKLQATTQAWQALWQPCGISPSSPAAMLEWLRTFDDWRNKVREREAAAAARAEAQATCEAFEQSLRDALPDTASPIDRLLPLAAQRVKAAIERSGERRELAKNLKASEDRLSDLRQQLTHCEHQHIAWQTAWSDLLAQLALPPDWQAATVAQLVVALEQAATDQRRADDLRKRIVDMQSERDEFTASAATLVNSLAPNLAELPVLAQVRELATRAAAAQQASTRLESLASEHARLERHRESETKRLSELIAQRDAMLRASGAADEVAFRRLAADAARRDKLREELRAAQRAMSVARQHEEEAAFAQELASLDHDALRVKRAEIETSLETVRATIEAANKDIGGLMVEMNELHKEGAALAAQQILEVHKGELREHVERYSALLLAEQVLDRAMQTFGREHQDNVLAEARRLFAQLTHGKYVDILPAANDAFWVVDGQSRELAPEQLSRGTREQLYLAFRLAYVKDYCRSREPLPFVMDDVLVNFDPQRASDTIAALHDLSRDVQIIFLTCHASTVAMFQEHAPGCATIELATAEPARV